MSKDKVMSIIYNTDKPLTQSEALDALFTKLGLAEATDNFCLLLKMSMALLGLDESDIGSMFGVGMMTVFRWRLGESEPHPAMRPVVYKAFQALIELRKVNQNYAAEV